MNRLLTSQLFTAQPYRLPLELLARHQPMEELVTVWSRTDSGATCVRGRRYSAGHQPSRVVQRCLEMETPTLAAWRGGWRLGVDIHLHVIVFSILPSYFKARRLDADEAAHIDGKSRAYLVVQSSLCRPSLYHRLLTTKI